MSDGHLKKIVAEGLKRAGLSARKASIEATGKEHLVKNIFEDRQPSFYSVEKLFKVLGINLTYSLDDDIPQSSTHVKLIGHVAAGGGDSMHDTAVTFSADNGVNDEFVSAPPGVSLKMADALYALKVKGNSMSPTYIDGDTVFLFHDDPARLDKDRLIGRDCVVTLESGDVFIKRLRRPDNGEQGFWNLESLNPAWPVMTDQLISEALPVRFVSKKI